jgi:EmrB/QacA subfamily drug resistance transporter
MTQADLSAPPLAGRLSSREKLLLLFSLALCMFMSSLDSSIVSTALPSMLADLGGFELLSWVFTIYLLTSTIVVPIVGKLSDMFGRRPFVIAGVLVFIVGSAGCGAATSMPMLIAARGVQGAGGGIILACVLAVMADMYTPVERAKYVGYVLAIITSATLIGPAVGGVITDGPGWRWCFYINLPVGAVAMTVIWRYLPNLRRPGKLSSIDFAGAALLAALTTSLLLALAWAQERYGWTDAATLGLLLAGAVLAVVFVLHERRHPQAIIPLHLFRNVVFVQTGLLVLLSSALLFASVQYLPTFIQTSLGASATSSGLISTPQSLGLLATSIIGGQVVARTGRFKYQIVLGTAFSALAAFLLATVDVGEAKWHIAVYMVVFGLGSGLVTPVMNVVVQSAVGQQYTGVATSAQMFFRQIAQVLGVALFGVLFTSTYSSSFDDRLDNGVGDALPGGVYAEFRDDPTLALDADRFAAIRDEVTAQSGGEELLTTVLASQREAVATATRRLFFASAIGGLVVVAVALTLKEIALRPRAQPAPAEQPVEPEGAEESLGPTGAVSKA